MNQNNEPETREELHRNYRRSIENGDNYDSNDNSEYRQDYNSTPPKKKRHYGRWIAGIIAVLLIIGIFSVSHQVSELSNNQRKTDTTLDKVIKNQGEQIAKEKAPANVKPQVIKIIQNTPLSELQRAANDQALFNQIANQNQVPQKYIQEAQTAWFNSENQALRQAIENGNLLAAYNDYRNSNNSSSSSSN
ncbi:hypothetical protein MOO44_01245 (plasmid) [Nicoliella spurrieriana]|uniref:Uncharacterized protein n=1 Tax=Nicoliella spurrieriana TaxID=2925830 RepID=A0A976RQN7_9LACO|nr:hypothetical protein [Nicoliella spurrieriana]UQS85972.1 hypothetical protein MOO44_01245 [Nicoliella spurrieriana]